MHTNKFNIEDRIDKTIEDVITIRHYLHENPELSECEIETSTFICNELKKLNIPYQSHIAGYGVVATITGLLPANTSSLYSGVGIRADIDALPMEEKSGLSYASKSPGLMHGCGHDMHTAILLGTASVLKSLEAEFSGTVKFFFQPSEETVGGAKEMIESGCLENPTIDAVIGLHVQPQYETGVLEFFPEEMNATSTEMSITITGESCHGAHPDQGIDSILIASHVVVALQSICSRNLDPTTPGIVTIGQFNGGTKNNIIPQSVTLGGIIRAMNQTTREQIKSQVQLIATNTATAFGGQATVDFIDSYPALINDIGLGEILLAVAKECVPNDKIVITKKPSLGADDFAYFSQAVPSVYFNLGTTTDPKKSPQALHSEHLVLDDEAIKTGILMEVKSVLRMLQ